MKGVYKTRHMRTTIWVLCYRVDWFKGRKITPDVHTYCFFSEAEAKENLSEMVDPSKYWIRKTYLQTGYAS